MPTEGSLEAPTRRPLGWRDDAFYDLDAIEAEMTRVFDICHGCRRCFNLCDAFPKLFDMIDASETMEIDGLDPKTDYKTVADACTLCDMCFMTKCPYVPPHEFDLDFPHLILRYRAAERRAGVKPPAPKALAETDRNGRLAKAAAPIANWASRRGNTLTRGLLEATLGVDADAELPKFRTHTLVSRVAQGDLARDDTAPARARKAVVYATCLANFNEPRIGEAALGVLAKNGVQTKTLHPACCGMPFLERGDLGRVASQAEKVAAAFEPWIDEGYDIVVLTASCGLMLKFEWPLILPENEKVKKLAAATFDICEYVVDIAKTEGLADGLGPIEGGVAVHMACHARAQNMGPKAAELLRLIPDAKIDVIERCSGHGGTFGVMKDTRDMAVKVAKPAVRAIAKTEAEHLCSDCGLAAKHLSALLAEITSRPALEPRHPIEIFAQAYGLAPA